ncbi:MAG: pilus assembly protein [Caldilineales bacterium]|nr:pilus assembly protein [Caldilineales bacterium]
MNRFFTSTDHEQGSSLVELALILPVVLVLTLGVVDVGRAFRTYIVLLGGARDGAYWLSLKPADTVGASQKVIEAAESIGLEGGDIAVSPVILNTDGVARISVSHTFVFFVGLLPQADVTMQIQVNMPLLETG